MFLKPDVTWSLEHVQRLGDGWLEERSCSDDSLRYSLFPFERMPKCNPCKIVQFLHGVKFWDDDSRKKCLDELV